MTPVYSSEEIRATDRLAVDDLAIPSLVLMENAARGACDVLLEAGIDLEGAAVVILCGRGNNGGDGIALARHLLIQAADVACVLVEEREGLSSDASAQLAMLEAVAPDTIVSWDEMSRAPGVFHVIVDALLGTGATGEPRGVYAEAVEWMNACDGYKLALDIPTGLDTDTGRASGVVFHADATATMAALKPGLLLRDGIVHAGTVSTVHIGFPAESYPQARTWLLDAELAALLLPDVEVGRHKYDRGKVLVLAGSVGMTGAGALAAESAARAGAGLVVYGFPSAAFPFPQALSAGIITRPVASSAQGTFAPDAMDELRQDIDSYDCVATGPGLRKGDASAALVRSLLSEVAAPIVIDADGLAPFSGRPEELAERSHPLIITPHHGEMARLLGMETEEVSADALAAAREAAVRTGAIVVLKGAPTIVATPDGDAWINMAGNPGMATGGTGDVLTGMIAALVAQTESPLFGTLAAVYLHSLAGDIAADINTEFSLVASDIVAQIPRAFRELTSEDE